MLDPQFIIAIYIFSATILSISFIMVVVMYFHFRRNARMSEVVSYLNSYIAHNTGDPVTLFAMLANALSGQDQVYAIWHLASLATVNNSTGALLAIRDHISAKDLRRTLKRWASGDLNSYVTGSPTIGQANGKKLICFVVGTRTIGHLDAELTATEHKMLHNRFNIHQPLVEVVASEAG